MPPWSLQNSQNWLIFSHVEKNCQKNKKIKTRAAATWATPKNSERNQYFMYPSTWIWRKIKIPCTRVHGFEEKTKYHVPGYMDLKKKQNSMYRGTWNIDFFTILMCSSGGGGPGFCFFIFLAIFFNMLKIFSIFGIL